MDKHDNCYRYIKWNYDEIKTHRYLHVWSLLQTSPTSKNKRPCCCVAWLCLPHTRHHTGAPFCNISRLPHSSVTRRSHCLVVVGQLACLRLEIMVWLFSELCSTNLQTHNIRIWHDIDYIASLKKLLKLIDRSYKCQLLSDDIS